LVILDTNKLPEVIDLFSGCGGLSLGFNKSGFHIGAGLELMPSAVETASYNLHWRYGEDLAHLCGDITQIEPSVFMENVGSNGCIVIGGPPCQAYSLVGRAKLRSLGEDRKNTNDSRGYLFQDFLRFAYGLDAKAVIMENVPESVDYGGINVPERVARSLEKHGYTAYWTILNAADYGVPQVRERVILIAIRDDLGKSISLPIPTHKNPDGTKTQNQLRFKSLSENKHFVIPPVSDNDLPDWVTVEDALSDLPELFPTWQRKYKLEKITTPMQYRTSSQNEFQKTMRNWFGYENPSVTGNCFRKTLRDYPIFEKMEQGDDYIAASKIADELFAKACRIRGITVENKAEYEKLKKEIVPPYARDKFISKWQKLRLDKPSYTVTAHLSVDTYSHIHPIEPRGLSVREAARIQSFPDGFLLQCSMSDAFKQIGNAVPPLLAKAIADEVIKAF